jgi:NAD(P)-dependent dehydrogenase (short-subunit alcohol dehydrogenase family)
MGAHAALVLVTGSTDGIGRETAFQLARRGARVILHGRTPERLKAALAELTRVAGRPMPEPLRGDLRSFEAVRAMARELGERQEAVEVLVNNAGIYQREKELSPDGIELTMAVNHFAPFLLTHLLLAGKTGAGLKRVVNVASIAHARGQIDLSDPKGLAHFDPYGSYANSKLANVLFTVELAFRLGERDIAVNALHPGVVSTKLLTAGFGMQGSDSVEDAAATSVMLALDPVGARVSGGYFVSRREAKPSAAARDPKLAHRYYEESAKIVKVAPLPEPA